MGATAQDLETLVVRLVGEASSYNRVLKDAVVATEMASTEIAQITDKNMGASNHAMKEATKAAGATAAALKEVKQAAPAAQHMSYALQAVAKSEYLVAKAAEKEQYELQAVAKSEYLVAKEAAKLAQEEKRLAEVERAATAAAAALATAQAKAAAATHQGWVNVRAFGDKMQQVGGSIRNFGTMVTLGVTLPIVAAGAACLKLAADMEMTKVRFGVMLGEDKGAAMLKSLREFSDVTPFEAGPVVEAGRLLLAFGVDIEHVMPTMRMLSDVSSATGKDLAELAHIFGRTKSTGKVEGIEMRQLSLIGFDLKEMAKVMGTDMEGLYKKVEEGKVPFEALQETFRRMTAEGGKFYQMTKKLSETGVGQWSTLMSHLKALAIDFGDELLPVAKEFMGVISRLVGWFKDLSPAMKRVIIYTALAAAAIGPLLVVVGSLISMLGSLVSIAGFLGVTSIPTLIAGVGSAVSAMAAALPVIGAVIAALWEAVALAAPFAAAFAIIALAVVMVADAISGGKIGINEWIFSIKLGGHTIADSLTIAAADISSVWEAVVSRLQIMWSDFVFGFEEIGAMVYRAALTVAGAVSRLFGGDGYKKEIDASLDASEKRWTEHSKFIAGLEKDHAGQVKAYDEVRVNAFANGKIKEIKDLKVPEIPEGKIEKWDPSMSHSHKHKEGSKDKEQDFKQVAISRISVSGLIGFGNGQKEKKQAVEAKGVEHRLDKLIAITQARRAPVLAE